MFIIPAIDIKSGKCVRLTRGRMDKVEVFYEKAIEAAILWQDQGASRLHVVDLDGAVSGSPRNYKVIKEIVEAVDVPVQLGGGIRDMDVLTQYIDAGIDRIILGTSVISDDDFFTDALRQYGNQIIVGIDALDGKASIKGWVEESDISALELALKVQQMGASRIIYTDISRDGTLTGPNLTGLRLMAETVDIKIIASGGVSSIEDIQDIINIGKNNIEAVIVGKALYSGNFSLEDAIALGG